MKYTIHTDGGSRGNPGPSAIGVCVFSNDGDSKNTVFELGRYIGETTNNEAEYAALLSSLEWVADHQTDLESVQWKLDSKLVVEQINKNWKIKEPRLRVLVEKCWYVLEKIQCSYTVSYIPREENSCADALVNQALDAQKAS
jgi:ribonuclease HI